MKPRKIEWPDYLTVPDEHTDDVLWLGELSGWQLVASRTADVWLTHRCGHARMVYSGEYLANAIVEIVYLHVECNPPRTLAELAAIHLGRPQPETLVWEGDQA